VGLFRPSEGKFLLVFDLPQTSGATVAIPDFEFSFGSEGDYPIVGNWNGVGGDEFGVWIPVKERLGENAYATVIANP